MKWFLFKMLFSRTGLKKTLKKFTIEELQLSYNKAVLEEEYELAAYLAYYLEFKRGKVKSPTI